MTDHISLTDPPADMKELVAKIRSGDGLTDTELTTAIKFYDQMNEGLKILGPYFFHGQCEVQQTLFRLKNFQEARRQR